MYTSQAKIEAFLKRPLTDDELLVLNDTITYISSFIDTYTGRKWMAYTEDEDEIELIATERLFDGHGKKELFVDDYMDVEEIVISSNYGVILNVPLTDIVQYPLNADIKSSIYLIYGRWYRGNGNINIKAIWGSGEVPADVIVVCTTLCSYFISDVYDSSKKYQSESIEGYTYHLADTSFGSVEVQGAMSTLNKFKKYRIYAI